MKKTKIRKTHGICNGAACIGRTQIPVWKLIALCTDGCSEENLLSDYPDLTKDDLKAAQIYYTQERAEIDARDRISKLWCLNCSINLAQYFKVMALIPCKECGTLNSSEAEICLSCEYPVKGRPKTNWLKGLALLLALIMVIPLALYTIQTISTQTNKPSLPSAK